MKYISSFIFIALLSWTWTLIHSFEAVSFETHANLQSKLSELIRETVKIKKPAAEDLQIMRLWTEQLSDQKVRAVFAYKFFEQSEQNEPVESIIEGEAILIREGDGSDEIDSWKLDSVSTTSDMVTFTEGVIVGPNAEAPESAEGIPTPTEGTPTNPEATPAAPIPATTPEVTPPSSATPAPPASQD